MEIMGIAFERSAPQKKGMKQNALFSIKCFVSIIDTTALYIFRKPSWSRLCRYYNFFVCESKNFVYTFYICTWADCLEFPFGLEYIEDLFYFFASLTWIQTYCLGSSLIMVMCSYLYVTFPYDMLTHSRMTFFCQFIFIYKCR